jgi:hypothetical protein
VQVGRGTVQPDFDAFPKHAKSRAKNRSCLRIFHLIKIAFSISEIARKTKKPTFQWPPHDRVCPPGAAQSHFLMFFGLILNIKSADFPYLKCASSSLFLLHILKSNRLHWQEPVTAEYIDLQP